MADKHSHFFATAQNFLDPQFDGKGNPYAPIRYKELVKECYIITKNSNIPYSDVLNMSFMERQYILSFIAEEFKQIEQRSQEQQEKIKQLQKK